jgi:hypothetical protein
MPCIPARTHAPRRTGFPVCRATRRIAWLAIPACILLLGQLATAGGALASDRITKSVQVGLSVARLSSSDAPQGDSRTRAGIIAGFGLRFPLTPGLELQSGALIAQRGGRYDVVFRLRPYDPALGTGVARYKLDYLEVPLLLRLEAMEPGRARISLLAGPGLAFKVHSHKVYTDLEMGIPDPPDELLAPDAWARDVTASLSVGVGLDWPGDDVGFSLDVLYGFGLVDLQVVDGFTVKQRSLSVIGGLSF